MGPCLFRLHGTERLPQAAWTRFVEGYSPPEGPHARVVDVRFGDELDDAPGLDEGIDLRPTGEGGLEHAGPVWSLAVTGLGAGESVVADVRFRSAVAARGVHVEALVMLFRALTATVAVLDGGLLVHGSAFVPEGGRGALVAVGPSGHGKSTMLSRLPLALALADDTVLLQRDAPGVWQVYGTPFAGKERLPRVGGPVRLQRVLALTPHAPRLALEALDPGAAFRELVTRSFWFVREGELAGRLMALVHALAAEVPVHRLASSLHHDIAPLFTSAAPATQEAPCSAA
ncbi:MAG: hypothetical protein R3F39_01635 [Myxococcota bacterium]